MQHMRIETHIEAPVEEVWKFFCDMSNWPDWMPRGTFTDVSGPLDEVGTTYVGGMKFMGQEFKTKYEIVEVEPLRLIHERSDFAEDWFRFEPDGDPVITCQRVWTSKGKGQEIRVEPYQRLSVDLHVGPGHPRRSAGSRASSSSGHTSCPCRLRFSRGPQAVGQPHVVAQRL